MGLGHIVRVLHSKIREHAKRGTGVTHSLAQAITKEPPRSPHWPTIEKRQKKLYPFCAACGSSKNVQIHHVESFKTHPELELHDGTGVDPSTPPADGKSNFISLCMSTLECHLKVGHGGSFAHGGYNPNVRADAASVKQVLRLRPNAGPADLAHVWEQAKAARVTE